MMKHKTQDMTATTMVTLDNPLGLAFDTPKSERNLRGSTVFSEPGRQANERRREAVEERAVSTHFSYAFTVS